MATQEEINNLKTNDFIKLPGVFDLAVVSYNYGYGSKAFSVVTDKGAGRTVYEKDFENLEVIPNFDFENFYNTRIAKIKSTEEIKEAILDMLHNQETRVKFQHICLLEQGSTDGLSSIKQQFNLPYLEGIDYRPRMAPKGQDKTFNFTNFKRSNRHSELVYKYEFNEVEKFNLSNMDAKFAAGAEKLTTTTYLSTKFKSLIESLECKEEIKTHLLSGNYYFDMQFVDITGDKTIMFTPKKKSLVFEGTRISEKNRQEMKPHKFFNRVLKDISGVEEYDIKCFTDSCIANMDEYKVEYVEGHDIGKQYNQIDTDCWITDSCMWGQDEDWFDLYADNPFRMGIIYANNEVVGRFLEVTADDNFVYNDRLYHRDNEVLAWYNSWCDTNDTIRRTVTGFAGLKGFYQKSKGGEFEQEVVITLVKPITDYEYLPYMDTLRYVGEGYNNLNNKEYLGVSLEGTDGDYEGTDYRWDVIAKTFRYEDDLRTIQVGEYAGQYTHYNNCTTNEDGLLMIKEDLL